jgi:hypothetical protein
VGLVDVALDRVDRQVHRLGLFDRQPQPGVGAQVAAPGAGGHGDLTDGAGPELAALLVLTALAVLNICPLAVSGHGFLSRCLVFSKQAPSLLSGARNAPAGTGNSGQGFW